MKNIFNYLRNLPETDKKVIFFSTLIFFGILLFAWNVVSTKHGLEKISQGLENFKLPKFDFETTDFSSQFSNINRMVSEGLAENIPMENVSESNGQIFTDEFLHLENTSPSNQPVFN